MLETWSAAGSCVDGECRYSAVLRQCPEGCDADDGRCAGSPDACEGVFCDAPPGPCFEARGTCEGEGCVYRPLDIDAPCEDGDPCTTGDVCDGGGRCLPAEVVVCDTPPAPGCIDETTWEAHDAPGACVGGECRYARSEVQCHDGCDLATDACLGATCDGVACDASPGPCFEAEGTCRRGVCHYDPLGEGEGCDEGDACTLEDTCDGRGTCRPGPPVVCDAPPGAECLDETTSREQRAHGRCVEGECTYEARDVPCESACVAETGRCDIGACAGVVCEEPPGDCFEADGECVEGRCEYAPKSPAGAECDDEDACTTEDACTDDGTCAGVRVGCSDPPASECLDQTVLRVHQEPGTCVGGECVYESDEVQCEAGCDEAAASCAEAGEDAREAGSGEDADAGLVGGEGPEDGPMQGSSGGCSCRLAHRDGGSSLLLALLGLLGLRRRLLP